eukprot:4469680-Ditylum_brightwellii.AAC.1
MKDLKTDSLKVSTKLTSQDLYKDMTISSIAINPLNSNDNSGQAKNMVNPTVKQFKIPYTTNDDSTQPSCPSSLQTPGSTIANDIKVKSYSSKESPVKTAIHKADSFVIAT